MPKRVVDAQVCQLKHLNNKYFTLEIKPFEKLEKIQAGQFLQLTVPNAHDVFLRRPISIHDVDYEANIITLLIQIVGKGTKKLSLLNKGDLVNIIYPLGKGYTIISKNQKALLVGGGCGIAPLLYLAKELKKVGVYQDIIIGFKSKEDIIEYELYNAIAPTHVTTEDGSMGEKGFVTSHHLFSDLKRYDIVYTCGPEVMMKAVAKLAKEKGVECEVSLENTMACGIGACLCCVTPTVHGHQCVCTKGPVFNSKELLW
ncbi:MAG: dihydroorotate dehydrogenase electron transfer subunit [Bacteroidales bacterium]